MIKSESQYYLTIDQRLFIVNKHKIGISYADLKEEFYQLYHREIYDSTISRTWNRYLERGSVEDLERSGRPSIYSEREERAFVRESLKHPEQSIRDLANDPIVNPKHASKTTLNDVLLDNDVISKAYPLRMDDLTEKNIKKRKRFAKTYKSWQKCDWDLVIFSDESDILPTKCGKRYIRLRVGQDPTTAILPQKASKKNLTIKVWGVVSSLGVGPLVRYDGTMKADKYLEMLQTHLIQAFPFLETPYLGDHRMEIEMPPWYFVDDNASSHTEKNVMNWIRTKGIKTFDWPSKSPDLNLIENIWAYLEDELFKIREELNSPDDTWARTQELWDNIPQAFIENLYNSMPNRMKELIEKKGKCILY